jgi:hypothetical protein
MCHLHLPTFFTARHYHCNFVIILIPI